jgi:hypothetical protein
VGKIAFLREVQKEKMVVGDSWFGHARPLDPPLLSERVEGLVEAAKAKQRCPASLSRKRCVVAVFAGCD